MLLQNLRARVGARINGDSESGFTLIELLVVMLILGILAAIALPAFFNQKEKAGDAKAKENAHTAQVAMETCATENGGSYTGVTHRRRCTKSSRRFPPLNPKRAKKESKSRPPQRTNTKSNRFRRTISTFSIVNEAGALTYPCTPKESGGCPASETWNK